MAEATASPRLAPRHPLEIGIDRIWRFFCSVRMAVAEIALLAVLVLIGTLRGSSVPESIAVLLPFTRGLVDVWYAWDVYTSPLFIGLLGLIAVAIAICTINRAPGIWASISHPTVTTTHGFLRNAEHAGSLTSDLPPVDLQQRLAAVFRSVGYRPLHEQRRDEIHVYADRFRYAPLGTFPFHLALILILVGAVVTARWGFREVAFLVPEGSTRAIGRGSDLSFRLDEFTETYYETGIAQEYRSDFTLLVDGQPVTTASVQVNHPFTYGDMTFYQSGFGQAVVLRITDSGGNVRYEDAAPLGQFHASGNPDALAAILDLPQAGLSVTVISPDMAPGNQPELDDLKLRSGEMYLLFAPLGPESSLREPFATRVSQGEPVQAGEMAVTFVREKRFAALQVARNPGINIFYAASILLVGGLAVTFYFPHRRIRGIISPTSNGGSSVVLVPLARRDWGGQQAFSRTLDAIERQLATPVTRRERPSPELRVGAAPLPTAP